MDPRSYKFRIHRFVDQSARHERSGGLSTAKIHDFPARVFLDRSEKSLKKQQEVKLAAGGD